MKRFAALSAIVIFAALPVAAQNSYLQTSPRRIPTPSAWNNLLEVAQAQSFKPEGGQKTFLADTLTYSFTKTYKSETYLGLMKPWKKTKETDPNIEFEDLELLAVREGLVSVAGGVALPISNGSKQAGRRFTLLLDPRFEKKISRWVFGISNTFSYYNNQYSTINDADEEYTEVYSSWTKTFIRYNFSKSWYFRTKPSLYQSGNSKNELDQTYTVSTGFGYKPNKDTALVASYLQNDNIETENSFFSKDIASFELRFLWSL